MNNRCFYLLFGIGWSILAAFAPEVRSQQVETEYDSLATPEFEAAFRTIYGDPVSTPFLQPLPKLYFISLVLEEVVVERKPDGSFYIEKQVGGYRSGAPGFLSARDFSSAHRQHAMKENWRRLILEAGQREQRRRGLLDLSLAIPGGRESAFTTIFGTPEVNLRVNGVASMNVGASIQRSEDPNLPEDQRTRVDPAFDQSLQLNIQGNIGDKLTIQTDWDTERAFDYQNRVNIIYEGYEDEIIKSIELGNVSMSTGNSLIRGSGALFGIKSVAELGSLRLTSVVSQQDGESNVETITGGAQERPILLRPADYSDDRHFFLDFYTRQEFENSMANPQQPFQTLQIADIEVWIMREQVQTGEGDRRAVALSEMGVVEAPDGSYTPPNNDLDPFGQELLDQFRDPQIGISASDLGVQDSRDFEAGFFTPLEEGMDYTVNKVSGTISLRRTLGGREVLAVAYTYRGAGGEMINVGELNRGGNDRIFLKKLRPKNVSTDHTLFPLTMRNVYSLGVENVSRETLDLELLYTEENIERNRLPGRNTTLLQDLGLDRVDSQGSLQPDNQIDFGTGTLDAQNGFIIFPYLEPFGSRMAEILEGSPASAEDIQRLTYSELYTERQRNAAQSSKNSFYRLNGITSGGAQDHYTLGFALVEGSVRVFANGTELQENIDYQVDYSFGSITILNQRYTAAGQEIRIEYENQALTSIEQKTFTGLRAEYQFTNDINLGGTFFRFSERPLDDKIRIGDEPVNNSVLGLDANARFDLPFLTRSLDAFPLLQTREASEFQFSGEFAQLFPGIAETRAVSRAIRNNELFPDEEEGLSFIDDFEGADIKINLANATRWHLAAAPAAIPGYEPDRAIFEEDDFPGQPASTLQSRKERSDLRSKFSWYTIPRNIGTILGGVEFTPESQPVEVTDVFPGRETHDPQESIINTLDVFYNPTARGQYNYNMDLRKLLEDEPEKTWGGMTAVIPSGQEDFTQNSIEFLEFWVKPVLPDGQIPGAATIDDYDGTIYIDIGLVSEDVIPNNRLNTEDGLALNPNALVLDDSNNPRSALPTNPSPPQGQFSNVSSDREIEDVGLDGLPSTGGVNGLNEQTVFADFIDEMRQQYGANSEGFQKIWEDPSNDTYVHYQETQVQDRPLHERFHRVLGFLEGNTPLDQSEKIAATNRPNTEGLVNPASVNLTDAYFQYEVELNPADESRLEIGTPGTFIFDRSGTTPQDRWYQIRIPLDEFKRKVGDINDFQNITYIRIWMSGYKKPFTLRFATLEFIGSQWRKDEQVNMESDPGAELRVSSINIEENANRRPIPYRQPAGAIRGQNRATQLQSLQNEQSLALEVRNLNPGAVQMVKRVYPGGLNLLNYSNMRMFVHGEGYNNREDAELVMRFGNDLENNYYEYRQPVMPSDPNFPWQDFNPADNVQLEREAEEVWLYEENSMNIVLSAFNQLKQLRDQEGVPVSEMYERSGLLADAAPGAVVAIKGNPSLGRVSEIGIGIRNPFNPEDPSGPGTPVLNAQFWTNELRVSGFDNESGWAASARSSIKLADFSTVNVNVTRQTQGFGPLDSRLGQRRDSNEFAYDINTITSLDRFIPERYGWNIPVGFTMRRSTSVPKFLPDQGDIRLTDFEQAVRARDDLTPSEQDRLIDEQIHASETVHESFSLNVSNLTKRNSRNWLVKNTLDNITANYVYNKNHARNPEYSLQDGWNYNGSVRYDLNIREVRFIRPFSFFERLPLVHVLSGLQLGTMPNNITTSLSARRSYDERRRRISEGEEEFPLQQTHNFSYTTIFGLGYNLTRSIALNFQAQGEFDLAGASVRDAGFEGTDSTAYTPIPSMTVFQDLLRGEISPRRSNYAENYTASWQPRFNQLRALNWMTYHARYSGGYRWENSPQGTSLGATVSNTFRLDHTFRLDMNNLLRRIPFYENAVELDMREQRERENRRGRDTNENEDVESYSLGEQITYVGRKLLLAAVSLQSLDINYNNAKTASQAGYAGGSQFFDLFNSDALTPSFGYRIGLSDRINETHLISHPGESGAIQLPANNTYSDHFSWTARFLPFQNVSIDLNWQAQWDERLTESITLDPNDEFLSVRSATGNITTSVWAFGKGYGELFERQLQTAFDQMSPTENVITGHSADGEGATVLNTTRLQRDFRQAYLGGDTSIGKRSFTPVPLPNWQINWQGVESFIPLLGQFMQRATITHSYAGLYRVGWNLNNNPDEPITRRLGVYTVEDFLPEFDPSTVNVERRFSPLAQLNITWENGLRTQIGYETSHITSLALSNTQVTERTSKGLRFSVAYTLRNFRLPLLRRRANNIDFTLNGSFIEDTEQRFMLDTDLGDALREDAEFIERDPSVYSFTPREPTGQSRFNGSATIGYRFSQTIQANFIYDFSQILPKSTSLFKRTTHDIRFNIQINIRST